MNAYDHLDHQSMHEMSVILKACSMKITEACFTRSHNYNSENETIVRNDMCQPASGQGPWTSEWMGTVNTNQKFKYLLLSQN